MQSAKRTIFARAIDDFTWGYITTLFWCTSEDEFPEYCYSGEFSITEEDAERLSVGTLETIIDDCASFQNSCAELLEQTGASDFRNGGDFALTRNRHGAGFWDRGYGESGTKLTKMSRPYGEFYLYLGDDGRIYANG